MSGTSVRRIAARRRSFWVGGLLSVAVALVASAVPASGATSVRAVTAGASSKSDPTAYITNYQSGTVSVLRGTAVIRTINGVGPGPTGIAVAPGGTTAYVADFGYLGAPGDTVTPIDLATGTPGSPITVGSGPYAIAVSADGRYAVVDLLGAGDKGDQVVRITLAGGVVSKPVKVGRAPESLAISPDSTTAYVGSYGARSADASVTPVDIASATPRALTPIALPGTAPSAQGQAESGATMIMAEGGKTLLVTDAARARLIPISVPSGSIGAAIKFQCRKQGDVGCSPEALAITPNGRSAWVAAAGSSFLLKVDLSRSAVVEEAPTGGYPDGVGLADGWIYTANAASNDATVFHDGTIVAAPSTGEYPLGVVVVPAS
jgi:DNA-binding beta-propeller fold protein YncE